MSRTTCMLLTRWWCGRWWLAAGAFLGILCYLGLTVMGHPQCVNADPAQASSTPLTMCTEYSDFGCCTPDSERQLVRQYEHMRHRLRAEDWERCQDYARKLLCQRCSPYAAHVFDTEISDTSTRKLPGLCPNYCAHFFTTCRDLVWFFDEDLAASDSFQSKEHFCEGAKISDMDYCFPDFSGEEAAGAVSESSTSEGCLCLEPIVSDLAVPLYARHAGDNTSRLFVAEQRGLVYIVNPDTKQRLPTPFLNITDKIILTYYFGDERGLNGLAFHPDFVNNGRFFVHYNLPLRSRAELTEKEKSLGVRFDHKTRISEFRVSSTDPNRADPSTERILLEVNQPYANHNGGEMFFLDGYLYLFFGDGGKAGDPHNLAQDLTSLLGKVLRLDMDTPPSGDLPYSIPADNPFIGQDGARPEIFAYGVRNIWRCGIDTGDRNTGEGRGRVLCGDVGQSLYEELDLLKKGANYGWRAREGYECYDTEMCHNLDPKHLEAPVYVYDHAVGKSVTGGQFYRGCESPSLNGKYLYGDYMVGRLFSLEETAGDRWVNKDIKMCGPDTCKDGLTNHVDTYIISFGLDQRGEVYVLSSPRSTANVNDGGVYKIVDPFSKNRANCER